MNYVSYHAYSWLILVGEGNNDVATRRQIGQAME